MYNHAPDNYVCPFCRIVQKQDKERIPDIIYQNEDITAFIVREQCQNNLGQAVVIPNQHFENFYDLPINLVTQINECARKLALTMKASYLCDGITLQQNNEPAGDQKVWHYHLHIIPRYKGDEFYFNLERKIVLEEKRAKYAKKLKQLL